MINRATAMNLATRRIGKLYNDSDSGKPVIRFTMTEGKRREIAALAKGYQTCVEDYWCPVSGRPWSDADFTHIMHVINGRITGRRNKGRKRLRRAAA